MVLLRGGLQPGQILTGGVYTCPIAGTRPRGKNEEEDERLTEELLTDEKEKAALPSGSFKVPDTANAA